MVLSAFGTSVFAGEMKKEGSVGIGYVMPTGDVAELAKGGLGFGLEYEGYKINDMFTIGAGLFITSGKGKSDAKVAGVTVDYSAYTFSTWGLTPFIKTEKAIDLAGKKANLYGLVGLGFYNTKTECGGLSASATNIGFNIGGGVMLPLADKMQLGFDLKYHTVSESGSSWAYLVPAVKFTYSF